ncbi:MAG: cyclic nucleotide-binding domain-containing protein, partial [Thermodesulfobacteriota bacterium]|nr:cyclic nucleotide-binding domain-containing protein [Thermodesulfobacteriota bacterium]
EFFGEMALIDNKLRSAKVQVIEDATLGFLSRKKFDRIISKMDKTSFKFMSAICYTFFNHIRRLDESYAQAKSLFKNSLIQI